MNLSLLIDVFLHLDRYLNVMIGQYHGMVYVFLFLAIFVETGLVITPFLPGDSLIFAVAAVAAAGGPIQVPLTLALLFAAAVAGDTLNYQIGHFLRDRIKKREHVRLIKMEYIDRTQAFFERHGGKAITIARFIPIIRTFAPFVAGVGEMPYRWFLGYNVAGGAAWVSLLFSIGYFFGNIRYVKEHFSLVVVAIVLISVLPVLVGWIRSKRAAGGRPGNDAGKKERAKG